jgi:hypothetical protein
MTREIHCLLCSATATKTLSGMMQDLPDGWIYLEGNNNREAHVCDKCSAKVPTKPNPLATVG